MSDEKAYGLRADGKGLLLNDETMQTCNMDERSNEEKLFADIARKARRIDELKEALRLALSFCPSGYVPSGLDSSFYHTGKYENDVKLHNKLDAARESLK